MFRLGPLIVNSGLWIAVNQRNGPNHMRLGWGHCTGAPNDALSETCNAYQPISTPRRSFVGHSEALSRESYATNKSGFAERLLFASCL